MRILRWFLGLILATASGLFLIWAVLHLALIALLFMLFSHLLHHGFQGIEYFLIPVAVVAVAITLMKCIFVPKW